LASQAIKAGQIEFTRDREIRIPGWLLTPEAPGSVDADGAPHRRSGGVELGRRGRICERLCTKGGCRVATIDLRGRGDCAIAYPQRSRFYFPNRITNEAYLT